MNDSETPYPSGLLESLRDQLAGVLKGKICFDSASRFLYACDASNYRQIPLGVVIPQDEDDIIQTLRCCREKGIPVLSRGGGTSLAGQGCNEAVVLDTSQSFNRILEIDPESKTARVQPGVVLDQLQKEAKKFGLMFGPDPSTHSRCTLGGMIGNDACGIRSIRTGRTVHNLESLKVITYEGKIYDLKKGAEPGDIADTLKKLISRYGTEIKKKFPDIPRRVSGYGLDQLLDENGFHIARSLAGSEGTCVFILEAVVKLTGLPRNRALGIAGFQTIDAAADAVPEIMKLRPLGLEGMDLRMVDAIRRKGLSMPQLDQLPEGNAWLYIEMDAREADELNSKMERLKQTVERAKDFSAFHPCVSEKDQKDFWAIRETGPGATVFVPGRKNTYAGWEDSAVAPEKLGAYLRDLDRLLNQYRLEFSLYGHFGDGCIHARIAFDFESPEGRKVFRKFIEEAADLVIRYGGSLSGEHGDGQARGELLEKMYGAELIEAFQSYKTIWDPQNKMNPGKLVFPRKLDEDLKYDTGPAPEKEESLFRYPDDDGKFSNAVSRCVGLGKCRRLEGGIMCPSYQATLEERHSPRGRARLLQEMIRGELSESDPAIRHALDYCLSCKACKTECPTQVDVATYKAEFLNRYYRHHKRPIRHYLFSYLSTWSSLGSMLPGVSNRMMKSNRIKSWLGIAKERELPSLQKQSFRHWFQKRKKKYQRYEAPEVLLWDDTFGRYFDSKALVAATEVMESMGFQVRLPENPLCCGRPFYDTGMLEPARAYLNQIMQSLHSAITRGVPVVVLEPSCLAVFKNELLDLFPNHLFAEKLSRQTFSFSEFINRYPSKLNAGKKLENLFLQGHCHQSGRDGMQADQALLSRISSHAGIYQSACCGMAGAFGYEENKHELSKKIADQGILAELSKLDGVTPVVSDGFSCREQIRQLSGKTANHLAVYVRDCVSI